ncbi:Hyaluronan/mRNA-binding protein domain-containing protein [Abortiporus biennis]
MTRTERATYPRAILKDRTESKSGMDKHTPKQGAGTHNWGSLMDERELEDEAAFDEQRDAGINGTKAENKGAERRTSSVTEEDREKAREFRKNALKSGEVDLAAIARTSAAVSTSPPTKTPITTDADTSAIKSA